VLVLGIETSCDETGVALVDDRSGAVVAEAVASQDELHAPYAGVVPELAARRHLDLLEPLTAKVLRDAGITANHIDLVAVTRGPGLAGCLLAGVSFAKGLAYALGVPVLGVNHLEAHVYSCFAAGEIEYPAVALVVSGGHTLLASIPEWGRYELLGQTRDDAVGEAYDKVASMLGLPYPGGPAIEARARRAEHAVRFPRPLLKSGDLQFSLSGLKTAVLYRLKASRGAPLGEAEIDAIARGFQEAVVEVLRAKTIEGARRMRVRSVLLAGGVARNEALRQGIEREAASRGMRLVCSPKQYCTDNGVMIAMLACRKWAGGQRDGWDLDIDPGLRLC
jgi:N6-L-threonylcarbamoyladenine synthase